MAQNNIVLRVAFKEEDRRLLGDAAALLESFLGWCAGSPHDTVLCRIGHDAEYEPTQYTDETDNNIYILIRDYLKSHLEVGQ